MESKEKNNNNTNTNTEMFVILKQDLSILNKGDKLKLENKYIQIPCGDGMVTLDVFESPDIFEIVN